MTKTNRNKGILFWITGLSGSGKTSLAKKLFPYVIKNYGPTILLDGDILRNILNLKGFSFNERMLNAKKYIKIAKLLTDQGINVVFALVCLIDKPRAWNKKNIKKYIEIYIESDVKKITKIDKKKIYYSKKNIVGINIKPQFPKKPDIIIRNNFDKSLNKIDKELKLKIKELLVKKKYAT